MSAAEEAAAVDPAVEMREKAEASLSDARAIARAALGAEPAGMKPLGGGLSNLVYELTDRSEGPLILRLSPDEGKLTDYRKEAWAMQQAASVDVPVPETLDVGARSGHAYMLQRKAEGVEGTDHPDRLAIHREVGRLARALHGVPTRGFGHVFDPDRQLFTRHATWAEYLSEELEVEKRLAILDENRMLSAAQTMRVHAVLHEIGAWEHAPSLNHGDMRLKNVIVDAQGKVAAVLDWEFCASTIAPHWDLSLALHDLSIDAKHRFLEGYGLSEQEIVAMAEVMKAFNIVNYAPFVARAVEEGDEVLLERFRTRFSGALDLYSI
jgi:hygromycin-B 4-O-kinase